jgi:L-seryl-tRNA(Ser) seleniumtransferase
MSRTVLRELPSVSALLDHSEIAPLLKGRRRFWMTRVAQDVVAGLRARLLRDGRAPAGGKAALLAEAAETLKAEHAQLLRPTLTRVLNGTGVVVHTNLGRAKYPESAVAWSANAGRYNCDLEFVLETAERGHRGRKIERKAALLTGAEDALVVNNNAAAVWLAARYCTQGGKLILSRGEVVAIGGSFRMHEILAETGCELVEIGTTNRTDLRDYEEAVVPGATVMKVHRSNFRVEGFIAETSLTDLARLCAERGCRLIYDAGSGALYPFADLGLPPDERPLAEDVATGVDLTTCSGDKLLGGCQAGLVLGRSDLIAGLREHPMRRAFRVDKTILAALDAVLTLYLAAEDRPDVPTLNQLATPVSELQSRAQQLVDELQPSAPRDWIATVAETTASVGGGAYSTINLPSCSILWKGPKKELEACYTRLRLGDPALVGRINQDGLAVDLRTVTAEELPLVSAAFAAAWRALGIDDDDRQ